jgi:hypothetical protein
MLHSKKTVFLFCVWQCPPAQHRSVEQAPPGTEEGWQASPITDEDKSHPAYWPQSQLLTPSIPPPTMKAKGNWRTTKTHHGGRQVAVVQMVGAGLVAVWGRGGGDARGAGGAVGNGGASNDADASMSGVEVVHRKWRYHRHLRWQCKRS